MTSHDTDGLEGDVKTHEKERIVFHDNMKMQNMNNMNMDTMKMNMDAHGSMGSMEHMDMMVRVRLNKYKDKSAGCII